MVRRRTELSRRSVDGYDPIDWQTDAARVRTMHVAGRQQGVPRQFYRFRLQTMRRPATIRGLTDAFEEARGALQTSGTTFRAVGHAQQTREILGRCVIEVVKLGERDQRWLRDAAAAHWAEANIRKARE